MTDEIYSCAFTGHRPRSFSFGYDESDPAFSALYERLRNTVIQLCNAGCRRFYCGMAEGVDLWCGQIVLELKDRFSPPLEIFPVVPFLGQPSGMTPKNKERYRRIMAAASERYLVSASYHKDCFARRNRCLVDFADALVAVYKETEAKSGTGQTIRYAEKKRKKIFFVPAE